MSIIDYSAKSVGSARVLFNMDITQENTQWVNNGAGIWAVNADAIYDWVDSTLLTGFTAQNIPQVGSVLVDYVQLTEAATLLECSDNPGTFYWDGETLYIHIEDSSSPYLHVISLGIVTGYSDVGFTPTGSSIPYDSRLLSVPSINQSRDPLYWGKIQYEGGTVTINNADGENDLLGESYNVYGNQARIYLGFTDLDISDYELLFTGFIETLRINEQNITIAFKDKRKSLTKKITYSCTDKNALEAIEEILFDNYELPYNGLYYNTTKWETEKAKALNVTIDMQSAESAIEVIQNICNSTFGMFITDPDGKYSFRIVRPGDAAIHKIPESDIINYPTLTYDPSEVITSTLIGYAKDWTTTGSAYTYLNDTSKEDDIFEKYKIYNERKFDTYLANISDAQTFSDIILAYAGTIRPTLEIEVPIKYWNVQVGEFADVEINRPAASWLGERKCEVLRKTFNLDRNTITLTIKKYGDELSYRITTDGYMRVTSDNYLRKVGQ